MQGLIAVAEEAPSLEVRDAAGGLLRFTLDKEVMIVGRSAEAEIRLDHGMVSRQHAQFIRDPSGRLSVKDLGSRNGTTVNGVPVQERTIGPGDRIVVGPFAMTVHFPPAEHPLHQTTRIPVSDLLGGRISTFGEMSLPRVSAAHLTTLSDFSQELLSIPEPKKRLEAICKLMTGSQFQGNWAVVVRLPENATGDEHEILCQSHPKNPAQHTAEPYLSRSVLRAIREKREAVLAGNTGGMPTDVQMSIASNVVPIANLACPLTRGTDYFDLIYVSLPPQFGTGEWLALASLAARQFLQAESAWAARLQAESHAVMSQDLMRARKIQMRLVPENPEIAGLDVAIGFVPCRGVGGDYVDVVPMVDGRTLLAVADVCGKGLGAALVAQGLHTMVHASILAGLGLRQFMNNLNRYLRQTLPRESFVTMVAVSLDPATGELECVNAGHPSPLIVSPGGQARPLPCESGLPLSVDDGEVEYSTYRIEPGELLSLYTDGLSELDLPSGEMLGTTGLQQELQTAYSSLAISARDAAAGLSRRLDELLGGIHANDDRTFLLARRV